MSRRLSTRQHQNNAKKSIEAARVESAESDPEDVLAIESNRMPGSMDFVGVKSFYTQEQRLRSFANAGARKRQSNAKKGSKAPKLSWPANHPAPELMAQAGFYFKPAAGDEDNVACFICQKNMSEWDPDDDPAEQHLRHNSSCGWALTMCRKLAVDGNITDDPLGDEMCKARRMTFDNWWPHEGKKGWKPSVYNVVMAGFIFRPHDTGSDSVYCPYCTLSVDAWECDDNPREVHETLGTKNCLFLQHGSIAEKPMINNKKKFTVALDDTEDVKEKAGLKRRTSRPRKPATNIQRKKATPKSQTDPEGRQDVVFPGGDVNADETEPRRMACGKKRESSAMEEGSQKPLFSNYEDTTKIFKDQKYIEEKETSKPPPTKRRITRASIASQPSNFDLVVNVPNHLAHTGDEDDFGSPSLHNTPIKPKPKDKKKKAVRPSSAPIKPRKNKKQNATETPVELTSPDDTENGQALEQDIEGTQDINVGETDVENGQSVIRAKVEDPLALGDSGTLEIEPVEKSVTDSTQKTAKKTYPAEPELKPESIQTQPNNPAKSRRKRLTKTKPMNRISTDTGAEPVPKTPPRSTPEPTIAAGTDSISRDVTDTVANQPRVLNSVTDSHLPSTSSVPAPKHGPNEPNVLAQPELGATQPKAPTSAPPLMPTVPADAKDGNIFNMKDYGNKNAISKEECSPRKTSTQLTVNRPVSISPSKDKDMKRKSDVVVDSEKDGRTGKKRKTAKATKPRAVSKSGLEEPVLTSETSGKDPALDAKGDISSELRSPETSIPKDLSLPAKATGPNKNAKQTEVISGPNLQSPLHSEQAADKSEAFPYEEEETILDDVEQTTTLPSAGPGSNIGKSLALEDNTISTVLSGYERSPKGDTESLSPADYTSPFQIAKAPSIPSSPDDIASQDSIPNTQFSVLASQMTLATSFQGSSKGVSFVRTSEERLLMEQGASFAVETREQSILVSPKSTRTPLSVIPKPHNGTLALATPRNRDEGASFAPVQSLKPWKLTSVESCIEAIKENTDMEVFSHGLPMSERRMTVAEWITDMSKKAEKRLIHKGELLVRFFEDEAERAVAAIEAIEAE
ncbi:hypothetical protein ABW20_dc0103003 [Dactylellina cionopaga]|nr:hypothetical protein ABW20_dc0103003 [Dactylellina cionopaga]